MALAVEPGDFRVFLAKFARFAGGVGAGCQQERS